MNMETIFIIIVMVTQHIPTSQIPTRWESDIMIVMTTTIIMMITLLSDTNFEETLSTLKYAHTTKSVNNRPVMNIDQDPKDKMIRFATHKKQFWTFNICCRIEGIYSHCLPVPNKFFVFYLPYSPPDMSTLLLKDLFQGATERDQELTTPTRQPESRYRTLLKRTLKVSNK